VFRLTPEPALVYFRGTICSSFQDGRGLRPHTGGLLRGRLAILTWARGIFLREQRGFVVARWFRAESGFNYLLSASSKYRWHSLVDVWLLPRRTFGRASPPPFTLESLYCCALLRSASRRQIFFKIFRRLLSMIRRLHARSEVPSGTTQMLDENHLFRLLKFIMEASPFGVVPVRF